MYVALGEFLNIQNILNTFRSIIVFLNCIIFGKINKKKFEPFFIINILLRCHKMSSLSFIFSPQCNWLSATSKKEKFKIFSLWVGVVHVINGPKSSELGTIAHARDNFLQNPQVNLIGLESPFFSKRKFNEFKRLDEWVN